jgi:ABC-type multidrug transport system fused ATPase/permease subunit
MQLERAAAVLRPRRSWEAIDLGFHMARRWFLPLWLLWMTTAFPLFLLLHLLMPGSFGLALLLFWWLKPLYEPALTDWLGRALFNEQTPVRAQLRRFPRILTRGLAGNLTWRRLFPSRSFFLCVQQLEGLRGERFSQRMKLLLSTSPNSGWLTVLMVHIETILYLGMIGLVIMLLPETMEVDFGLLDSISHSAMVAWIMSIFYLLAASVVAPFYVAAGFSLYINSRTDLEAWDIEIDFRRIAREASQRRQPGTSGGSALAVVVLLASGILLTDPGTAHALEREEARESIAEILSHEDFGKQVTRQEWRAIEEPDTASGDRNGTAFSLGNFEWLALLLRLLAYAVIALFAGWLVFRITQSLGGLELPRKRRKATTSPEHRLLQADQGNHESIPDNPVHAVMTLCEAGQLRRAMSLLYRATILHYIRQQKLEIPDSATEGECLQLVRARRPQQESRYFETLTRSWQGLAYAGYRLSAEELAALCRQWPAVYSGEADAS